MSLRILVVGGYGMIGLSILRALIDDGHDVTALGRDADWGRRQEGRCRWVSGDIARMLAPHDWERHLETVDIIVNASGALQTGLRDHLDNLQHRAIVALAKAASAHPERLFIQISAPGAEPEAPTEFLSTKGKADAHLRASPLKWVVLKPALVIAPEAYGGTALVRMLAAFPLVLPLVHARSKVATVDIAEVVEAVRLAIAGTIRPGSDLEIAAEHPLSLEEIVLTFRCWLGYRQPGLILRLPAAIGQLSGWLADGLGLLGWRSPLRSTAIDVIAGGVTVDPQPYRLASGRNPATLKDSLQRRQSTVQERWFARLYLLMPVIIATLSGFWLASGIVGLLRLDDAASILRQAGFGSILSAAFVAAGSLADIALGLMVLLRPATRWAMAGMIAVTLAYLCAGTIWTPYLWADPLGPLVKSIPAALLALVGMQLVETR